MSENPTNRVGWASPTKWWLSERYQDVNMVAGTLFQLFRYITSMQAEKFQRLERLRAVESVALWCTLRVLRNQLFHEYLDAPELRAAVVNRFVKGADELLATWEQADNYAMRYQNSESGPWRALDVIQDSLFGLGAIPKKLLPVLQEEGIVLSDEGIGGWPIAENLKSPGKR